MTTNFSWLPPMVLNPGNWNTYLEILYRYFTDDFIHSQPKFDNKRVALKRQPVINGKEATFWHFISEKSPDSSLEEDRIPNFRRCERIRWVKPVMEQYGEQNTIRWWKTTRPSNRGTVHRIILALADFSYVVIVDERKEYVLPWTQFPVEHAKQREKLKREHNEYWGTQKAGDTI